MIMLLVTSQVVGRVGYNYADDINGLSRFMATSFPGYLLSSRPFFLLCPCPLCLKMAQGSLMKQKMMVR